MRILLWIAVGLGVVVAAVAGAIALGLRSFDVQMDGEAAALLDSAQSPPAGVITEADLGDLPAPVQRYLRRSGVVGKPRIQSAVVQQKGAFRTAQDGSWMPTRARESYTVDPPGFVWQAHISMASLPILTVRDHYRDGEGRVLAKIGGLFAVADERADEAALMRYFNELMWLPTAYLGDNVVWEPVDEHHARATMTDRGMSASALFTFNDEGDIVNFAADRYCSLTADIERWETPIDQWAEFQGFRVPLHGQGVWKLADGDFAYIDLGILDISYQTGSQ